MAVSNKTNQQDETKDNSKRSAKTEKFENNNRQSRRQRNARKFKDVSKDGNVNSVDGNTDDSKGNDPAWYFHYPELMNAAAMAQFVNKPGMSVAVAASGTINDLLTLQHVIPGVMRISFVPTVGRTNSADSPISIVGKEMYARVRRAYSGTLRADGPDYPIFMEALANVCAYIASLKRIFRVVSSWNYENYMFPDTVLTALGVASAQQKKQLLSNKMRLYSNINELIRMAGKFSCPAVFDVFNRLYWLNDNMFTDAEGLNSQLFLFTQTYYYKFANVNTPAGVPAGGLVLEPVPWYENSGLTGNIVDSMFDFGVELINAIVAWDDAYTINGYLARAFEGTSNFVIEPLQYSETPVPLYSTEVLSQIENCRVCGVSTTPAIVKAAFQVSQDPSTNALFCSNTFTFPKDGVPGYASSQIQLYPSINMHKKANVTPEEVVVASRMQSVIDTISVNDTGATEVSLITGTEVPLSIHLFTGSSTIPLQTMNVTSYSTTDVTVSATAVGALSAFDWHPFLYFFKAGNGTTADPTFQGIIGDIDNLAVLSVDMYRQINKVALYSEFNTFSIDS